MKFVTFLKEHKQAVIAAVKEIISDYKQHEFIRRYPWGIDALNKIEAFTTDGKMARGALTILGFNLMNDTLPSKEIYRVASVAEVLHTALLAQDDVMDHDVLRRGKPTIFVQYDQTIPKQEQHGITHGGSMAILLGDVAIYLANNIILNSKTLDDNKKIALLQSVSDFITGAALGQMMDVGFSAGSTTPSEDNVKSMLEGKTSLYTFALPLTIGAIANDAPVSLLNKIKQFSYHAGICFQTKDDELSLFGNQAEFGKRIGNDILEAKKTLFYVYLYKLNDTDILQRIDHIFGNSEASNADIEYVLHLMKVHGVHAQVTKLIQDEAQKAFEVVDMMDEIAQDKRELLKDIIHFSIERTS
jgi:geranylgeranyl pyrophosphate synthase